MSDDSDADTLLNESEILKWRKMTQLSIGIQSLYFLNLSKYDKLLNVNSDNYDKKAATKIVSLQKYLKRFVIDYIGLSIDTINVNKLRSGLKVAQITQLQLQCAANLCIGLAYFVLGNDFKAMKYLKQYVEFLTDINLKASILIDSFSKVNAMVNKIIASSATMSQISQLKRAKYLCKIIKHIQNRVVLMNNCKEKHETAKMNQNVNNVSPNAIDLVLNPMTRDVSQFVKWKRLATDKNAIVECRCCMKRLKNCIKYKICRRCRMAYYCSKKCQKKDWAYSTPPHRQLLSFFK